MSAKGLIYFICGVEAGLTRCKIGFTSGEPDKRLAALQSGSPLKLGIYCAFPGTMETEKVFHQTFAPLRVHGEWFDVRHKLFDFLICMEEAALSRQPADWVDVFHAIEMSVLADKPYRESDDPAEYAASADTKPWDWMRALLAAEDQEIEALAAK